MRAGGTAFPRWMNGSLLPRVVRAQRPGVRLALAFVGISLGILASNLADSPAGDSVPLHVVAAVLSVAGVWWLVLVVSDLFTCDYGSQHLPLMLLVGAGVGFVSGYLGSHYDPLTNAVMGGLLVGGFALGAGWMVLAMRRRLPPPPETAPPISDV